MRDGTHRIAPSRPASNCDSAACPNPTIPPIGACPKLPVFKHSLNRLKSGYFPAKFVTISYTMVMLCADSLRANIHRFRGQPPATERVLFSFEIPQLGIGSAHSVLGSGIARPYSERRNW